jgi:hypothetical protein
MMKDFPAPKTKAKHPEKPAPKQKRFGLKPDAPKRGPQPTPPMPGFEPPKKRRGR